MEKTVSVIGTGLGGKETLTFGAAKRIEKSGLLIGAKRLLEEFSETGAETFAAIAPEEIAKKIRETDVTEISVLFSGDIGFYSGAKRLYPLLEGIRVETFPGIGSLGYFCAKLKIPWEDVNLVSAHGRDCNAVAEVWNHERAFFLTGGENTPSAVCEALCNAGFSGLRVFVGERLSYPEERISEMTAAEAAGETFDSLSVLLVENPSPFCPNPATHGLADEEFLRSQEPPVIPMTKSEVRSVSLSKLCLQPDSIVYDIGAGTGSVSVEAARICRNGTVYAVERNPRAVKLLRENRERFGTPNLQIVEGFAPEALAGLPKPDRAFVGGSGGNLREILSVLLEKNPEIRVVVNTVALESLAEAVEAFRELGFQRTDVVQMNVAKSRKVGGYQMMMGQNPVYVLTGQGGSV